MTSPKKAAPLSQPKTANGEMAATRGRVGAARRRLHERGGGVCGARRHPRELPARRYAKVIHVGAHSELELTYLAVPHVGCHRRVSIRAIDRACVDPCSAPYRLREGKLLHARMFYFDVVAVVDFLDRAPRAAAPVGAAPA